MFLHVEHADIDFFAAGAGEPAPVHGHGAAPRPVRVSVWHHGGAAAYCAGSGAVRAAQGANAAARANTGTALSPPCNVIMVTDAWQLWL